MPIDDETIRRLEQAIAEAHRTRPVPLLGSEWGERVMRDVRRAANAGVRGVVAPVVEQLVWRTAGLAAAVALVMTASLFAWSHMSSPDGVGAATEELESAQLYFD